VYEHGRGVFSPGFVPCSRASLPDLEQEEIGVYEYEYEYEYEYVYE